MLSMLIVENISDVIKSNKMFHVVVVVVAGNVRIYPSMCVLMLNFVLVN